MRARTLVTDLTDLVLGRACLQCQIPGRPLCELCLEDARGLGALVDLPVGLLDLRVGHALPYRGLGSDLVLAYKERGNRALADALGVLLADAVSIVVTDISTAGPRHWALIPIPGHRRPERGFAALDAIAAGARRELRRQGTAVTIQPLLELTTRHRPMKQLDRRERWRSVTGSMSVRATQIRPHDMVGYIVIDDVVTTGATLKEADRALRAAGVLVHGFAAVALTAAPGA